LPDVGSNDQRGSCARYALPIKCIAFKQNWPF
jgi:hypothetical protein